MFSDDECKSGFNGTHVISEKSLGIGVWLFTRSWLGNLLG